MRGLNKKYLEITMYISLGFCIVALFTVLLINFETVSATIDKIISTIAPIFYGFALAYLMGPIINWLENSFIVSLFHNSSHKRTHMIATLFSYATLITIMVIFVSVVFPELTASIVELIDRAPEYFDESVNFIVQIYDKIPFIETPLTEADIDAMSQELLDALFVWVTDNVPEMLSLSFSVAGALFSIIISTVVSVYVVESHGKMKGQLKKVLYAMLPIKVVNKMIDLAHDADKIFGGFIKGKIIDSFIIGLICYFFMYIFGMPEATFISFVIGVTNIIPYFGPFIGGIPMGILMFFLNPSYGIIFAIFVILLQQFDGNILGPLILADSIGISAFWVVVSVTVAGGLFGFWGMLFGVPAFALIQKILGDISRARLEKKNLPLDSAEYQEKGFKIEQDKTISSGSERHF